MVLVVPKQRGPTSMPSIRVGRNWFTDRRPEGPPGHGAAVARQYEKQTSLVLNLGA